MKYRNTEIKTTKKNNDNRAAYQPVEFSPFALAVRDEMVAQMTDFLNAEDKKSALKFLFDIGSNPAQLKGFGDYDVYQLERTARMDRKDPTRWGRLTTNMVAIDRKTGVPAFFCTCFITPGGDYNVTVYEQGEQGPVYPKTVRFDSRSSNKDK